MATIGERLVIGSKDEYYALILSRCKGPSATRILELGCYEGDVVERLRRLGYAARGVDGNKEVACGFEGKGFLHCGEITSLDDIFREERFDLVAARGVFALLPQFLYYLSKTNRGLSDADIPEREWFLREIFEWSIRRMLESVYEILTPDGSFIAVEYPAEKVGFNREMAEKTGFSVEKHTGQFAILRKPAAAVV